MCKGRLCVDEVGLESSSVCFKNNGGTIITLEKRLSWKSPRDSKVGIPCKVLEGLTFTVSQGTESKDDMGPVDPVSLSSTWGVGWGHECVSDEIKYWGNTGPRNLLREQENVSISSDRCSSSSTNCNWLGNTMYARDEIGERYLRSKVGVLLCYSVYDINKGKMSTPLTLKEIFGL